VQVVVVSVATGGVVVSESAARTVENAVSETAAQNESSMVWRNMVMGFPLDRIICRALAVFERPAQGVRRGRPL
jgi:uncharacterized membrane protein